MKIKTVSFSAKFLMVISLMTLEWSVFSRKSLWNTEYEEAAESVNWDSDSERDLASSEDSSEQPE